MTNDAEIQCRMGMDFCKTDGTDIITGVRCPSNLVDFMQYSPCNGRINLEADRVSTEDTKTCDKRDPITRAVAYLLA